MMETILSFMLVEHLWNGVLGEPEKGVGYPRMLTPHRRPYQTRDGFISVIAVSDKQWRTVFTAMGVPEFADDPRFATLAGRSDNVDALYGTLTEGMRQRTTAEWLAILRPNDIPCGPANSLLDLFDDAYLRETNFFEERTHPVEGKVVTTAFPARFSETPASIQRLWPTLGENNREVLREAGYTEAEIDDIIS